MIVDYIDGHKQEYGVEPICRMLTVHGCKIAPSTYYDVCAHRRQPSKRQVRDEELKVEIARVHRENYSVYGARKVWLQCHREGIGVARSIGATGNSYDNALAESINGLYKTELIKAQGPWRAVDQVEVPTLEWVDWFNHRRLYEHCGDLPPAEYEAVYYRDHRTQPVAEFSNS